MLLVLAIFAAILWLPSPWGLVAVIAAAVWEIAEIGVFVWWSQRRGARTGAEAMPGEIGVVVQPCRPVGQIRLGGELWRARCEEGADPGEIVVVESLGPDLTLLVRRA